MNLKIAIVVFLGFIAFGLGLYGLSVRGYYPVIAVNYHFISAAAADKYYGSAVNYLRGTIVASKADPAALDDKNQLEEIRRAVLDKLVENSLIYQEVKAREKENLDEKVKKKIEQVGDLDKLKEKAGVVYGLTSDDFVNLVLIPEAYREVLQDDMLSVREDFNEWLQEVKRKAGVFVFKKGFGWDGQGIKIMPQ
ncbi:MAG: Uncharacterized protein Athens071426_8 [Parcubacteria group bacterium Athens0714_26]|nr:MAG: Uncharacterized protein Athens101426_234 [Parcubacteria group bacterium Athens1014_26]TSD03801.1 MAG: Uncharacterized protein Athens071426_8 [Parcubacteria group bacterium Athens0714_26]